MGQLLSIEYPRLYLAITHHRNTRNEALDFQNHPYLLALYRDKATEIRVKKCVQAGVSEWLICDTFDHCQAGRSVFYTIPTQILRSTFVSNRIDRLSGTVPYYKKKLQEIKEGSDSTVMKHFGKGTMKFVGSNALSEFGEFPADVVTIDEFDRCNQENIKYARDRAQAAPVKYFREVGNPTIEDFGIDARFKESDQKFWHIRCEACGEWQCLDFFVNIVRQKNEGEWELLDLDWKADSTRDIQVYCKKCHAPIDRLKKGEWVARFPANPISGYQLSHTFIPTVSVKELWSLFQEGLGDETKKQVFHNSRLGIAFTSTGAKLTLGLLETCRGEHLLSTTGQDTAMGVDVGAKLHVEIRKSGSAIHIASYRDFSELDEVMAQFGVAVCVIDAMPETRKAKEFQAKHGRKVWLCRYFQQPNLQAIKRNENERTIEADRTQTLDASHAEILQAKIKLPKNFKTIDSGDFVEQMCAVTRIFDQDGQRYKWVEGDKPDHYRHAHNYAWMANQLIGKSVMIAMAEVSDAD